MIKLLPSTVVCVGREVSITEVAPNTFHAPLVLPPLQSRRITRLIPFANGSPHCALLPFAKCAYIESGPTLLGQFTGFIPIWKLSHPSRSLPLSSSTLEVRLPFATRLFGWFCGCIYGSIMGASYVFLSRGALSIWRPFNMVPFRYGALSNLDRSSKYREEHIILSVAIYLKVQL